MALSTSKPDGEAAAGAPSAASDTELREALANAIEGYALRVREHGDMPPFDREVAPTDVAITAAAILKAAEVYSFEIAAMFNV
jgi:hypothetical protein